MTTPTSVLAAVLLCCAAAAPAAPAAPVPRPAASSTVLAAGPTAPAATRPSARVVVVQAFPGVRVRLSVDGRHEGGVAGVGSVMGPFDLAPGRHQLSFTGPGEDPMVRTSLSVGAGTSTDVVLHRPASVRGAPVVNTYRTPTAPLGPGKARLLLAHTATVAPADVSFDGQVVFTDIANGEYADAEVPSGPHQVALLPSGVRARPFLGPLRVSLAPRTVSMVYAVGSPRDRSMRAIVHTVQVAADGSAAPRTIDTGSAGLVADVRVSPFSAR